MVSTLVFALLAADPAARFDAFMKAHPTFVATVEVMANDHVLGNGTLRVNRPRRIRFDFKNSAADYALSGTELGYVEVERREKIYDEHPSTGSLTVYSSRISGAQGYLPHHLIPQSTRGIFGNLKPTITVVPGGDELKAIIKNEIGESEIHLVVDPQGRPVRYLEKGQNGVFSWRLLSFTDGSPDLSNYRIEPPTGYVPYALPDLPIPLAIGETVPLTGWRKDGKAIDLGELQRGKARLLAVLSSDCPPSQAVKPSLANLAKTMPVLIIGPGEITDPSGSLLKKLSPPGTPMFYLVGGDGKVKNLWFGFDPAKAAAWEAEIKTAVQGSSKE